MRKTTENKKEKIVNWLKKNKERVEEVTVMIISIAFALLIYALNVNKPHGVQTMMTIVLCYLLYNQFYIQRVDNKINEMKEQEKK